MIQPLLRTICSWMLAGLIMLGNAPAWTHHSGCEHAKCSAANASADSHDACGNKHATSGKQADGSQSAGSKFRQRLAQHCCSHETPSDLGSSNTSLFVASADTDSHDASNCAACLLAVNGMVAALDTPAVAITSDVVTSSSVVTEVFTGLQSLERFHLRGPPALLA